MQTLKNASESEAFFTIDKIITDKEQLSFLQLQRLTFLNDISQRFHLPWQKTDMAPLPTQSPHLIFAYQQ
ncbi:protein of unknown function [Xenorhabdus poinarii G6]|uniref:Uncharacterized protein n=1 Tax=Xenorhabdus poinarii G6 TaxID=1354304 RepID=A0A068R1L3_9GAMM|nr:protein of unknown function [Xenorhabdus poinarii G6]